MRKVLGLIVKILSSPSEGLSKTIEGKPLIPAIILFVVSNLIIVLLSSIFLLDRGYSTQSTFINSGFLIKMLVPRLLLPFLSIFLIHFLSKTIYKSEGKMLTFLVCYLFIIAVIAIVISFINILFYTIFFISGNTGLINPYNFIIKIIQGGWGLILTIAAIMGVYDLSGKQAVIIWLIQILPFAAYAHFFK